MISFYIFTHRFKRSMLEITSDTPIDILWKYLNPLQKEKLPANVQFKVAAGKKAYDIIRLYESGEYFFSKKSLRFYPNLWICPIKVMPFKSKM